MEKFMRKNLKDNFLIKKIKEHFFASKTKKIQVEKFCPSKMKKIRELAAGPPRSLRPAARPPQLGAPLAL